MNITEIYTGPLFVKTWVIELTDGTVLLIDPGGADPELMQHLSKKKPKHLEIILTHGHFDHVGGVPELALHYPHAKILIHKADAKYLGESGKAAHMECFSRLHAERYVTALKYDFPEPTGFLDEGCNLYGFSVLHTPGHTEGSICLWHKEEAVLFAGDTLFFRSHGRTDLLDGNEKKMRNSLKKLLSLPDCTVVYPGHGANTAIGNERCWIEAM